MNAREAEESGYKEAKAHPGRPGEAVVADHIHVDQPGPARRVKNLAEPLVGLLGFLVLVGPVIFGLYGFCAGVAWNLPISWHWRIAAFLAMIFGIALARFRLGVITGRIQLSDD